MKAGFKKAGNVFKYLSILFAIIYWIYIIIDDWGFIEKYWIENWTEYIGGWFVWFLIYFLGFTLYYWAITTIIILMYYKLILRLKKNRQQLKLICELKTKKVRFHAL